MTIAFLYINH